MDDDKRIQFDPDAKATKMDDTTDNTIITAADETELPGINHDELPTINIPSLEEFTRPNILEGVSIGDNTGVYGSSKGGFGVVGTHNKSYSVSMIPQIGGFTPSYTWDPRSAGVYGVSVGAPGVIGESNSEPGVSGHSDTGVGIHGKGGRLAGLFEGGVEITEFLRLGGDAEVTGDIRLTNADCAEDFDVLDETESEPGTVMVLGEEGKLLPSFKPYDKCVAGVISGAGNYKPGIILDNQQSTQVRKPIALLGKVYCKVDASYAPIEVGDLLTTSPTLGHAMRVNDPFKALGTIIGKALRPLNEGQGLIPILIALQ